MSSLNHTAVHSSAAEGLAPDESQLETSPQLQRALEEQFGAAIPDANDAFTRRRWLQLMGASLALAGVSGCRFRKEVIAPHVHRPPGRSPGVPVRYASMVELGQSARPVLATSFDGRPIRLDGNPDHPMSGGASTPQVQAMILELYDPDRSRSPSRRQNNGWQDATWQQYWLESEPMMEQVRERGGAGLAILAEPTCSPTMHRLRRELLQQYPQARWFEFTSLGDDNERAGMQMAFGQVLRPDYALDTAAVIVTIDSDLIGQHPASISYAQRYALGRDADNRRMSRLYSIESQFSATGALADHRLAVRPSQMLSFVAALEEAVQRALDGNLTVDRSMDYAQRVLAAMAQDLVDNQGQSVIAAGWSASPEVHARVLRLNEQLGNLGQTVTFTEPLDAERQPLILQLQELTELASGGQIDTLIVLGGNPVFYAPSDINLAAALAAIDHTAHLSLYRDETSHACRWHLNAAHALEMWGDGLAWDGSWCLSQPLVEPLFGGISHASLIGHWIGQSSDAQQLAQETAIEFFGEQDFQRRWNRAVHDGFFADSAAAVVQPQLQNFANQQVSTAWDVAWDGQRVDLQFIPSTHVFDGRFANNGWLQELPDFVTKLTWDNAAWVNPDTAQRLGLRHGRMVTLSQGGAQISLPVLVAPGPAHGTVITALGYGRTAAGRVGGDQARRIPTVGHDVRPLRTGQNWDAAHGVAVHPTSTRHALAMVQQPWQIDRAGFQERQERTFRDHNGVMSELLREGSFQNYTYFLDHYYHAHDEAGDQTSGRQPEPGLTPVSAAADDRQQGDRPLPPAPAPPHVMPPHVEGHYEHWPTEFHAHFTPFDLTPPEYEYTETNQWSMAIDLNKCVGCNACVIACQSENNIPIVGRDQVLRRRELHWIRVDSYLGPNQYSNEAPVADQPYLVHQPMTCQQCGKAPCETVCPVAATKHSHEGLNDMVYNRCIGTRYCANNCPFKVRRFNYLNYSDAITLLKYPGADRLSEADRALQNLMMNPEVTIRSRGVMEKCTYCIQRIQNAKINARVEGRDLHGDEIRTACQDACPTGAIVFGDLGKESRVAELKANPRSYTLLDDLNLVPRTFYMARVRNPHPALSDEHLVRPGHQPSPSVQANGSHGSNSVHVEV